jgi:Fungal domain of unknown function (DUF1750)
LTQSKNPNAPPFDPSLWIVHYSRADRDHVVPSNQLPLQPPVQAALNQRRFLQSQGHLVRKEFMLHDKANWPTINLPSAQGLQYPPHMLARQQQAAAAAQMQMGASPMKNVSDRNQHRRGPSNVLEPTLEEEEDVSRGDMLDFMTPRDISRMRYEQHHEWMEEIMSSPFAMKQIVPTDLGLGRKGELEALTGGFFDTPTSVLQEITANASNSRIGRMEVGKAEEFTAKAARKVAEMEAELENLKRRHARRMAKLDKSSSLMTAEKGLRTAAAEGGHRNIFVGGEAGDGQSTRTNSDNIVQDVESDTGRKIVPVSNVECVQKGGLEEKPPTPKVSAPDESRSPGKGTDGSQPDVSNQDSPSAIAQGVSPNTQEQRQQQQHSSAHLQQTPQPVVSSHGHGMQQQVAGDAEREEPAVPSLDDMDVDVEMAGLENDDQQGGEQTGDNDGSEWVMVDDVSAKGVQTLADGQAPNEPVRETVASSAAAPTSEFVNTPTGSGIQGLTPAEQSGEGAGEPQGMSTGNFDLGQGDFDANIEDPTDALVDFGDHHGDLTLEGMDDSAFGDAFHPPEENHGHLSEHGDMS